MENILTYVAIALSATTLALCAWLVRKMNTVLYLLEQPSVRKMSPQLKLKPVKLDELMAERTRQQQQSRPQPQQNGPRPPYQGGRPHGEHRNDQDRRPDQGSRDRFENRDRPDRRPERGEGDRNRNNDRDRFRDRDRNRDRNQGGDRWRPPQNENRDAASAPISAVGEPPREPARSEAPAPSASHHESVAPLAPRRPLPSTVENESAREPVAPPAPSETESGSEGLFNSDDIQHGRRTQVKKKPRFDVAEEEVKTVTEG